MAVSADGSRAVSGGRWDTTVRVWDLATGRPLHILAGHDGPVLTVAVSADGSRAVSGDGDGTVRVWDLATGRPLHILAGHDGSVLTVAVSADGSRAVSGGGDRTVRVWDLAVGKQITPVRQRLARQRLTDRFARSTSHDRGVTTVAVSVDGSRVVSGGHDGTVRVWNLATGAPLHTLPATTARWRR